MKQSEIMLDGEGDAWLERNRDRLGKVDPVSELIKLAELRPTIVLEIGCSNGWRLHKLQQQYGCNVKGLDPSEKAGREARVPVWRGTADDLPFVSNQFDLVICGFFLYLADPADYFKIAAEVDRVLANEGHLIIHDFMSATPFKRRYAHYGGMYAHHFDSELLWLSSPVYRAERYHEDAVLMKKSFAGAFALQEEEP